MSKTNDKILKIFLEGNCLSTIAKMGQNSYGVSPPKPWRRRAR